MTIRRGDVYYADLRPVVGSEQGGVRPVIVAAITSQINKSKLPTHVELSARRYEMVKDSVILLEQLRTIDKRRLKERVCHLDGEILTKVDKALEISLELPT